LIDIALCQYPHMAIDEIERAIEKPSPADQAKLRLKIANDEWDRQIEEDARSGRLDKLFEKSLAEHRAGLSKKL
jgi:hypothetical protein